MTKNFYAEIKWNSSDVQTLADYMTDEEAEDWLSSNEKYIQDRTIELGWEVIEQLLPLDEDDFRKGNNNA